MPHMDRFIDALLSGKTGRIPEEYDWFAPLLGDWDCDYYDEPTEGYKRHVKGEWIFRRILEGTGVQDIFIFPSRATKETEPPKQGDRLVGKVLSEEDAYWIFSDITADRFHWENVRMKANGKKILVCEIFGKRIN